MSLVPNWIEAVTTAIAMLAAIAAAIMAWRTYGNDRRRDQAEREREARSIAMGLSVTWVHGLCRAASADSDDLWGVLVRNASAAAFYDVAIKASGNNHARGSTPIRFAVLPPGEYFVRSAERNSPFAWKQYQTGIGDSLVPVGRTAMTIDEVTYSDTFGREWRSTSGHLAQVGPASAPIEA